MSLGYALRMILRRVAVPARWSGLNVGLTLALALPGVPWIGYNDWVILKLGSGVTVRLISVFAFAVMLTWLGIVPSHAEKRVAEACKRGYVHNKDGECVHHTKTAARPSTDKGSGEGQILCTMGGCRMMPKNCRVIFDDNLAVVTSSPLICD